jgi:hypothetical protein
VSSGCCESVLNGHTEQLLAVCLSATGDQVTSGSEDNDEKTDRFILQCTELLYTQSVMSIFSAACTPRCLLDSSVSACTSISTSPSTVNSCGESGLDLRLVEPVSLSKVLGIAHKVGT